MNSQLLVKTSLFFLTVKDVIAHLGAQAQNLKFTLNSSLSLSSTSYCIYFEELSGPSLKYKDMHLVIFFF